MRGESLDYAVRSAVHLLKACGGRVSVRNVIALIRIANGGRSVRMDEVTKRLRDTVGIQSGYSFEHGGIQSETPRARDLSVLPKRLKDTTHLRELLPGLAENGKALPEWVVSLRTSANAIRQTALRSLTADERAVAGRYHAWRFGNCTKTERTNISRGSNVAVGLAKMGRSERYGGLTFGEYVAAGDRVHVSRDSAPWFDPFLIVAFEDGDEPVREGRR